MNWIRVALFTDALTAGEARNRLVGAGVPARIGHEPAAGRLWFVSSRDSGVRVETPADSSEAAARLLSDWDDGRECLRGAVRCPECGSFRIDFPQFTEKSVLTNLALGIVSVIGLVERDYYCEDCHLLWPKPAELWLSD